MSALQLNCMLVAFTAFSSPLLGQGNRREILWADNTTFGFRTGAIILTTHESLQAGQPIVVQFVLKNDSKMTSTIRIRTPETSGGMFTVSPENRIDGDVSTDSKASKIESAYRLAPGEILETREYRVSYPTKGLPAGVYELELGYTFWLAQMDGGNSFDSHRLDKTLRFEIVGDGATKMPPKSEQIQWGDCLTGICLGAALVEVDGQGRDLPSAGEFKEGSQLLTKLYVFNTTKEPMDVRLILWDNVLHPREKAAHLIDYRISDNPKPQAHALGTGFESVNLTLDPHEVVSLTGTDTGTAHRSISFIEKSAPPADSTSPLRMFAVPGRYRFIASVAYQIGENPNFQFSRRSGEIEFEIQSANAK